jgi:hypothetical protein
MTWLINLFGIITDKFGWYNLNSSNKYRFVKEMYEETRAMIQIQPLVDQVLSENSDNKIISGEQPVSLILEGKPKLFQYWHQGINEVPDIVRNCYSSVDHFLSDHFEIIRIEHSTLSDYIELPTHILKAREEERMTIAHFSDIIRNKLLLDYGGLWLDSTVLITGNEDVLEFTSLDNRLMFSRFVFSNPKEHAVQFESWIMWAKKPNNPVYYLADEISRLYWEKNLIVTNYFQYHIIFTCLFLKNHKFKELFSWHDRWYMGNSADLGRYLISRDYNRNELIKLFEKTDIHKLDFKVKDLLNGTFGTYFRSKNFIHELIQLTNKNTLKNTCYDKLH